LPAFDWSKFSWLLAVEICLVSPRLSLLDIALSAAVSVVMGAMSFCKVLLLLDLAIPYAIFISWYAMSAAAAALTSVMRWVRTSFPALYFL
jgi:hypothetical protein